VVRGGSEQSEAFFFEKRSKKLSFIAGGRGFAPANSVHLETDKSFLVLAVAACDPLFSKKNA
jgi:hypothetical protein